MTTPNSLVEIARRPLPNATADLAHKIWRSMRDPSTRCVATKLRQAGYLVSHMRVARWQQRGWTGVTRQHPLDLAEELRRTSFRDARPVRSLPVSLRAVRPAYPRSCELPLWPCLKPFEA